MHLYDPGAHIVYVEEEPLPSYTADYKIPETMPLSQPLNKPQMAVALKNVANRVSKMLHELEIFDKSVCFPKQRSSGDLQTPRQC